MKRKLTKTTRRGNALLSSSCLNESMGKKAVFFDRDNTLLHDTNYMYKVEDLAFMEGVIQTLKAIQLLGYELYIVTNQSGIGRGYFSEQQMHTFHQAMLAELQKHNIEIKAIAFCPHAPEDHCDCRKPSPKLIHELIKKYNIDPKQSFMVGDKLSDIESGENAGLTAILLGQGHKNSIQHFEDLLDFLQ